MRTVQVYIEGQRLELFKDEQINVTSVQQNVQDISKVFTDFSQSFSVPATPTNNAIFQHFYQNDVQSTIDHNIRRDAYIEIDLTTFRRGKMSLEKSEVKDNEAYSYQITFYGEITSLKDKFGEDKIQDLTLLNIYAHPYTATEIEDRITDGTTADVIRYPLITRRYLQYNNPALPNDDINTDTGAIKFNELFPAIRVPAILGAMQGKYGVTFEGDFLTDKRFQNCFLYCQNANEFEYYTTTEDVDFTTGGEGALNPSTDLYTEYFILADDTLTIVPVNFFTQFGVNPSSQFNEDQIDHQVLLQVSAASITAKYFIDVFINGVLSITITGGGSSPYQLVYRRRNNNINTQDVLNFRVRATESTTINVYCRYQQQGTDPSLFPTTYTNIFFANSSNVLSGDIDPIAYVPDMKVSDFFTGLLKEFNMTCYGIAEGVFQVEPIDDWYAKGAIVDVTQYTDIKSIKVDRIKLFRTINLQYQQSENILNSQFRDLFGREYGDAEVTFDYDGGEYKIEQPFENMQMNRFTGTDLQVGFTINKDLQTYVPKPMLLYMYDETPATFRFNKGTSIVTLSEYMPFGQDVKVLTENFSLNFNAEISTLTGLIEQNTLYANYYLGYLSNLFNLKNRRTTLKTNLPVSLLTELRLNDRLIIRDKRYIIESMKSSLTTGDVDFVLINDFRPLLADGQSNPIGPIIPSFENQCIDVRILFPNGVVQADITTTDAGVTITPSTLNSEGTVEVCIPANPNTTTVLKTEDDLDYINTEDPTYRIRTEGGTVAIYTLLVTYTYSNGTQTSNQIFIQQQP
jgi:hypothetical protein